jgi:hypothetical protein
MKALDKVYFVDLKTGDLFYDQSVNCVWGYVFVVYACLENNRVTFFAIDEENNIYSDVDFDPTEVKCTGGLDFDESVFLEGVIKVND